MKTIYIHAGLHKTGTSALQKVLFSNREHLMRQGFLYPAVGVPQSLAGHHNIAWQLSRDRRFRKEWGVVDQLLSILRDLDVSKVILSSEDFESSLTHPHRWMTLMESLKNLNYQTVLIIYNRHPVDYLRSLYGELLKAGMGEEFQNFAKQVISHNYCLYQDWQFHFDYQEITKALAGISNLKIWTRNYDQLLGHDIVTDFCDLIGVDNSSLNILEGVGKVNQALSVQNYLKLFLKNRGIPLTEKVCQLVDGLCDFEHGGFVVPLYWIDQMTHLCDGRPIPCAHENEQFNDRFLPKLNIVRVFSFETCGFILEISKTNNTDKKNQLIMNWRRWVTDEGGSKSVSNKILS